eukprot:280429-Amphidinium_carterae.1
MLSYRDLKLSSQSMPCFGLLGALGRLQISNLPDLCPLFVCVHSVVISMEPSSHQMLEAEESLFRSPLC